MTAAWVAVLLLCFLPLTVEAGEIALTFDDAPTPDSAVMSGRTRTAGIVRQLADAGVEGALFFATTQYLEADSAERLRAYTRAGHFLGNHSHSHLSANNLPVNEFLADAREAQLALRGFENNLALYRFPFLHHGETAATRHALRMGLKKWGYDVGYVTVDNYDWYINALYLKTIEQGNKIKIGNLKKLYLDILWGSIEFYDAIALQALGRSPKHVLLLHENDLAALFVGDLVRHIEAKGWKIIAAQEAYADPIARVDSDLSFTKQGRVAALAHAAGVPVEQLRHDSESAERIDQLFEQYNVIAE